jgi:hypothetical protein
LYAVIFPKRPASRLPAFDPLITFSGKCKLVRLVLCSFFRHAVTSYLLSLSWMT